MKNYLFMLIAGLCMMLAFSVDLPPDDVGKTENALIVDDVGVYPDVTIAVDYNLQTHGIQAKNYYVATDFSIPADELIPKPGWQNGVANEAFNDKQERLLFKTYRITG